MPVSKQGYLLLCSLDNFDIVTGSNNIILMLIISNYKLIPFLFPQQQKYWLVLNILYHLWHKKKIQWIRTPGCKRSGKSLSYKKAHVNHCPYRKIIKRVTAKVSPLLPTANDKLLKGFFDHDILPFVVNNIDA